MLGIALGTIGMDPVMGFRRYSFGLIYLVDRPHLIWMIVCLFAVPQIFSLSIFRREFQYLDLYLIP